MNNLRKSKSSQNQADTGATQTIIADQPKTKLRIVGGSDFARQWIELPLEQVEPSPANWRKAFVLESLSDLVDGIRENGVLEPILVRPKDARGIYQIIAGERRFRASQIAGKQKIPARILNLPEDKILDAHIQENLNRKDLTPLEEAAGYEATLSEAAVKGIQMSIAELALRVSRSPKDVAAILQLNKLVPEAEEAVAQNQLPYHLAYELAQYPSETQKEIFPEFCYEMEWIKGKYVPVMDKPVALRTLRERIASKILLDLSKVPFSLRSHELRADGLACVDCRSRTAAESLLFTDLNESKKDYCLEKDCFSGKMHRHVELISITVARGNLVKNQPKTKKGEQQPEISIKQLETEIKRIPRLSTSYYESDANILGMNSYKEISKAKDACDSAVKGVFVKGDRFGDSTLVCLASSKCQTHFKFYESSFSKIKTPDDYKKNRQQLFDLRADQYTRRKVFAQGAEAFDENNLLWNDIVLRRLTTAVLLESVSGYQHKNRLKLITELLGLEEKALESEKGGSSDGKIFDLYEKIGALSERVQSKLLYLLTVASFGENEYEERNVSQASVTTLATHQKLDYGLLGSIARVELCADRYKKQKPDAEKHLALVQTSESPIPFPKFYYDDSVKSEDISNSIAGETEGAESTTKLAA